MNLLPLVGLYWRRHQEIEELVASGSHSEGQSHLVLDVLNANAPLLKRWFPKQAASGLIDDVIKTLGEVLGPAPAVPTPGGTPDTA